MKMLLAENERGMACGLKYLLEKSGITVDIVHTGLDALYYFLNNRYDAVVLDTTLTGMNGLEVLSQIRSRGSNVLVMLLVSKSNVNDLMRGLEMGANDYMSKPVVTHEFVARVNAMMEANTNCSDCRVIYGNACLDCSNCELSCGKQSIRLNNKEFQLAELFFRHPRHVFSTDHLMDSVWGQNSRAGLEVIWTYIGLLRKKIRTINACVEIRTIRGEGYTLEDSRW